MQGTGDHESVDGTDIPKSRSERRAMTLLSDTLANAIDFLSYYTR